MKLIFTLLALGITLSACHRTPAPPLKESATPISVTIHLAEKNMRPYPMSITGTIVPRDRATIAAKVTATIEKIPPTLGEKVSSSQLLIQLQANEIRARLLQVQAQSDQADRDFRRLQKLSREGAATKSELENAESRAKISRAMVEEANSMLSYTQILAPFDGVITEKFANEGDLATPGTALLTIENTDALRVEAHVPETLLATLPPKEVAIFIPTRKETFTGKITEISPAADPTTRTFLVKIDLPPETNTNNKPPLRSGQFVRVTIAGPNRPAIFIPSEALHTNGQMEYVYLDTNGVAAMQLVKTGLRYNGQIEILSGLNGAERVVLDHSPALHEGVMLQRKNALPIKARQPTD